MDRSLRTAAILVLALLVLTAATLMAGCSRQQPLTVKIADNPTYGAILTDSTGRSLYVQARDVPNTGAVANLGEISRFYPPFYAESMDGGGGINISEFGYLTRADGKKQTTFRGWPLYYYINDRAPGDAKSQGANNITFLAKPDYTVMVRDNATVGVYLADVAGAPLLARENGTLDEPAAGCVPFRASPVIGPSPLVQPAEFGLTDGPAAGAQTTYRGMPLYAYVDRAHPNTVPLNLSGYAPVVLAQRSVLVGVSEAPTATPTATVAAGGTAATTAPATAAPVATTAPATARTRDDAYTGGEYTPTPFQTVQVINPATETPAQTWTPVPADTTPAPATPLPTLTPATPSLPSTTLTIPTANGTSRATTERTIVPTRTPTTARTTRPPTPTPPITPLPTAPPTPPPTTVPTTVPLPPVTTETTLPLPFPITLQATPPVVVTGDGVP